MAGAVGTDGTEGTAGKAGADGRDSGGGNAGSCTSGTAGTGTGPTWANADSATTSASPIPKSTHRFILVRSVGAGLPGRVTFGTSYVGASSAERLRAASRVIFCLPQRTALA